jgi:hypothetical protein
MAKNSSKSLPKSGSLDELVEFFESNDLGDYLDKMPQANFEVDLKRRTHLIALDESVALKLSEIAKAKRVSSQKLANSWLKEKLRSAEIRNRNS